jgi:hypothetical protein
MYEPVTQRAAAAILPGMSRHTKLLETRLTRTKQTTEPATSRHKTATPPHAIRVTGPRVTDPSSNRDTKTIKNGRNSNKTNNRGQF